MAKGTMMKLKGAPADVSVDGKPIDPAGNAPDALALHTFHNDIVMLGQGIRDGMVAVETGKKKSMERFMLASTSGELDPTNDVEFERNWMDWRHGESRDGIKRDRGQDSEMSRFKNFCIAALKMGERGLEFTDTIAAVQDTFKAVKMERAGDKKNPAPIQIERALSKVATLAKDHAPTADEIRAIVRGDAVLPAEVTKAKAAAEAKAKAAAVDPVQAGIDALIGQIEALIKVGVPADWRPVLRKVQHEVTLLGDSLVAEQETEEEGELENA